MHWKNQRNIQEWSNSNVTYTYTLCKQKFFLKNAMSPKDHIFKKYHVYKRHQIFKKCLQKIIC